MEIKDRRQVGTTEFFSVVMDNGVEIKDCKVVNGSKGAFVSGPARKGKDDKWFPLVYIPAAVGAQIMEMVSGEAQPPAFNDDDILF